MFIAVLFLTAKQWKWPQCPSTDEWTNRIWDVKRAELTLKE
jgi:hypothetical protein